MTRAFFRSYINRLLPLKDSRSGVGDQSAGVDNSLFGGRERDGFELFTFGDIFNDITDNFKFIVNVGIDLGTDNNIKSQIDGVGHKNPGEMFGDNIDLSQLSRLSDNDKLKLIGSMFGITEVESTFFTLMRYLTNKRAYFKIMENFIEYIDNEDSFFSKHFSKRGIDRTMFVIT